MGQANLCSGAGGKTVDFEAQVLQHGDEQVGQRMVVLVVEGQVLQLALRSGAIDSGEVGAAWACAAAAKSDNPIV